MILALGALLASAFLASGLARELPGLSLSLGSHAERVEHRTLHASVPSSDAQPLALVRSTAPAIARLKSPQGGDSDSAGSSHVAAAPAELFALRVLRAPGGAVQARSRGVRSPGQPAPSSRAPPLG
jgi:hypothetical protein